MPPLQIGIPAGAIGRGQSWAEQVLEPRVPPAGILEPADEITQRLLESGELHGGKILLLLFWRARQPDPLGGPGEARAGRAVDTADGQVERRPPGLEPVPDLLPDNLPRSRRELDPNAPLILEDPERCLPLRRPAADGGDPVGQPPPGIEHDPQGSLHGSEFERVEVALGEPGCERYLTAVGRQFRHRHQRDPARRGGPGVVGRGVDGGGHDTRIGGEGRQPAGQPVPLPRPVEHVEHHDHGLARSGGS